MSNWERQNPRSFRMEQPDERSEQSGSPGAQEAIRGLGWAGLHRVPVAHRQGTATVMLGSKNPATLTGGRGRKTEERFPGQKGGVTQPMWSFRGSKVLTLVPRWGRAEARLV